MIGFTRIFKVNIFGILIVAMALIAFIATPGHSQTQVTIENNTQLTAIGIGLPTTPIQIYIVGGSLSPASNGATLIIQEDLPNAVDISAGSSGALVGGLLLSPAGLNPTVSNNTILIEADSGTPAAKNIQGADYSFGGLAGSLTLIGGAVYDNTNPGEASKNTVTVGPGSISGELSGSIIGGLVQKEGKATENTLNLAETVTYVTGRQDSLNIVGGTVQYTNTTAAVTDLNMNVVNKNVVNLKGGFVLVDSTGGQEIIAGGLVLQGTAGGDNAGEGNKVDITGGTIGGANTTIVGGKADLGTAQYNTVDFTSGTMSKGEIVGGAVGTITGSGTTEYGPVLKNNSVTISDDAVVGTSSPTDLLRIKGGFIFNVTGQAAIVENNSVSITELDASISNLYIAD
ncbi:MAG: hypothetical protein LBF22_11495, partial [Deltaproteobacteria bacterium]|nr:hypothetical protein [Deltaproteobacteria bacterium]